MSGNGRSYRGKVLVVEDDPAVTYVLRFALRGGGFETVCVDTGKQALQVLGAGDISAVILDLGLPDSLAGAVLAHLRQGEDQRRGPRTWLVVSALDASDAEARYGPLGKRFVPKPFDAWQIVDRIGAALDGGGGSAAEHL